MCVQFVLVPLDVTDAVTAVAEPFGGVLPTQLLDQSLGASSDLLRKLNHVDPLQDDVVGLHRVGASERRTETRTHRSQPARVCNVQTDMTSICRQGGSELLMTSEGKKVGEKYAAEGETVRCKLFIRLSIIHL